MDDVGRKKGKLIALATCYTPGNESSDRANSSEPDAQLAKLSEAQRAFREEVRCLCTSILTGLTGAVADQPQSGCGLCQSLPPGYRRANMHVMDLSVAEEHRGQGYGSTLIQHIVAEASQLDASNTNMLMRTCLKANAQGVQTVLETSRLENVLFYHVKVYTIRQVAPSAGAEKGMILAIATCFSPGKDKSDMLDVPSIGL